MTPPSRAAAPPHQLAVDAARPAPVFLRRVRWLVAALVVSICWLLGALANPSGDAFALGAGTVPSGPVKVSASAGTTAKRRPQLAYDAVSRRTYMVWEEGAGNNSSLYYSWRDPGSGAWAAPALVGANWAGTATTINPDTARWTGATAVGKFYAHADVDPSGNLHVVFAAERSGTIGKGLYYTVWDPGGATWSLPARVDCTTAAACTGTTGLLNQDNNRLFVRSDPSLGYGAMGYVLWTAAADGQLKLTRVGYSAGTATRVPEAAIVNPAGAITQIAPVAVVEKDGTTLQLVYVVKNTGSTGGSGNGFFVAPLNLGVEPPSWGARTYVAAANGDECGGAVCTGATAAWNGASVTVAANLDFTTPTATHAIQVTASDGSASETLTDTRAGRQPVVVPYDTATGDLVLVYAQCTYVSSSSCTSKDLYFRVKSGGVWDSAGNATGPTTGEQKDIAAVIANPDVTSVDLHYAWVGNAQSAAEPGDQVYFDIIQAP